MFRKAERKQAKLKLALSGPSGSGKTYSALSLAEGIGKKIAVIDTENGSASLYADRFEFDTLQLRPPYEPKKYIEAIKAAVDAGYDVVIIDSLSHVWAGEGGVLDKKNALDSRGGNQFANWKGPKAEHQKFKDAILHSPIHTIVTLRAKQGYQVDEQSKKVLKVGLDPIAEPGLEYEYTLVFDLDMSHKAMASKDRTSLFDQRIFQVGKQTGEELMSWLNAAKPTEVTGEETAAWEASTSTPTAPPARASRKPSDRQLQRLFAIMNEAGLTADEMKAYAKERFGIESSKDLTVEQYDLLCTAMQKGEVPKIDPAAEPAGWAG